MSVSTTAFLVDFQLRYNQVGLLAAYLRGTKGTCLSQRRPSPSRLVRAGIRHLPALFNHFVSEFPIPDLDMTSYADDFTLLGFALTIVGNEKRANQLPNSPDEVGKWETAGHCFPKIQRNSVYFDRIPTSPGSTHKCESVTRWPFRTEP